MIHPVCLESEALQVTDNKRESNARMIAVLYSAILLTGWVAAQAQVSPSSEVGSGGFAQEYHIGVSDVLSVSVWNQESLNVSVPVRPDGRIAVPLLGEVEVAGRTPADVQAELTTGYEKFITAPAVSLVVTEINSRKVFVMGEVAAPGVFNILTPTTLLQVLSMAGGFTEFAKKDAVVIVRISNGQNQRFEVSVREITSGKNLDDNLLLLPGDTIYVP
jgi:polysaccharide export outer membrane protein